MRNAVFTDPTDQSAWIYQKFLFGEQINNVSLLSAHLFRHSNSLLEVVLVFNQRVKSISPELITIGGNCSNLDKSKLKSNSNTQRIEFVLDDSILGSNFTIEIFKGAFQGSQLEFLSSTVKIDGPNTESLPPLKSGMALTFKSDFIQKSTQMEQSPTIWAEELKHIEDLYELEPDSKCNTLN